MNFPNIPWQECLRRFLLWLAPLDPVSLFEERPKKVRDLPPMVGPGEWQTLSEEERWKIFREDIERRARLDSPFRRHY